VRTGPSRVVLANTSSGSVAVPVARGPRPKAVRPPRPAAGPGSRRPVRWRVPLPTPTARLVTGVAHNAPREGEQAQAVDVRVMRAHYHPLRSAADSDRQPVVRAAASRRSTSGRSPSTTAPAVPTGQPCRFARTSSRSRRIPVGGGTTSAVSRMFQGRPD
jgi:hypothetical protein